MPSLRLISKDFAPESTASDHEVDSGMETAIAEEGRFIDAIVEYDRCGRSERGKQFLIDRVDFLLLRVESRLRESLAEKEDVE